MTGVQSLEFTLWKERTSFLELFSNFHMCSVPCTPTPFPHTCRQTVKQQINKGKRSSHSPSWSGIETVSTFNENTVFMCLLQIYGSQSRRGGNETVFTFRLWWRNHQWAACDALYNCSEFSVSSHFFFFFYITMSFTLSTSWLLPFLLVHTLRCTRG